LQAKHISNELSPFKRWGQSSLRSRADPRTPLQRRPSSLVASESDVYTKTIRDNDEDDDFCTKSETQVVLPTGPTVWGQSFELLLNDPAGLHSFAEFLKKEFSGENIYFWTACERFRQINDISERTKEALAIFDKHLANGSLEPVNVDSQARLKAQDRLPSAEKDLFIQAQKQIFNLMKFDSYPRFIRSDLYKTCLDAENRNLPLPYPAEQLDPMLRITVQQSSSTMTKLKKSLSNAEDRRRKSLLPWHRKARCKSKDREENKESMKNSTSSSNTLKHNSNHSVGDIHSSRSSLSSFDATISKISSFDEDTRSSLCRVILSNGATTIVQTKVNETIRELVERLLDKRGISYQAYEAFLSGTTKPLDLDGLSKQLAGNEVLIEQRVIFKLDLPNKKVISVKSKTCKMLSEVLRPILHKYQYRLDWVEVYGRESPDPLDMSLSVTAVDGQRLQIVCKEENPELVGEVTAINTAQNAKTKQSPQNFKLGNVPVTFVRANKLTTSASNPQLNTLDEITNKVFNELLQGKADGQGLPNGVNVNVRQSDQESGSCRRVERKL
jgi:regulator of G-protein signaling